MLQPCKQVSSSITTEEVGHVDFSLMVLDITANATPTRL